MIAHQVLSIIPLKSVLGSSVMVYCVSSYRDLNFIPHLQPWSSFFIVKNIQSQAITLSSSFSEYAGYNNPIDYLGKTDYALKCRGYELAELFMKHDREIISRNENRTFLYISYESNHELSIYYMTKESINSHMICNAKILSHQELGKSLFEQLKSIPSHHLKKINTFYEVVNSYENLSPRETETYYLLLQRKSSNDIAAQLSLSPRTIQHYIENIKLKMNCTSTQELIELGMYLKLHEKMPFGLALPSRS